MPTNYYLVLGIPSDATHDEIKQAYRRLAKTLHPDCGQTSVSPFLAVQEAYAVLSDPKRRQDHDRSVRQSAHTERPAPTDRYIRAEPVIQPEPLIPDPQPTPHRFQTRMATLDHFFDDLMGSLRPLESPRQPVGMTNDVNAVIRLTPDQARRGGQVEVLVPIEHLCPSCSGTGWTGPYTCWRCGTEGRISGRLPIMLHSPPNIQDGHVVNLSLDRFGLWGERLIVQFRIADN